MRIKTIVITAAAALLLAGGEARADWGFGLGGLGYGGLGLGYAYGNPYAAGRIPTPPYYSIHPPVYYGHIVHRTYGRSPYAYSSGNYVAPSMRVMIPSPETVQGSPRMIENQHMKKKRRKRAEVRRDNGPLLVINPYVEQGVELAAHDAATRR